MVENPKTFKYSDIGESVITPISVVYYEGIYHLFLSKRIKMFYYLEHYSSLDFEYFTKEKTLEKSLFPIRTGSTLIRANKIFLIYEKWRFGYKIRLTISKNTIDFLNYPLEILKEHRKLSFPRMLFSEGEYFMLSSFNKGKGIKLLKSQHLVDWIETGTDITDNIKNKFLYPSNANFGNRNALVYFDANINSTVINECIIDVKDKKYELLENKKTFEGLFKPRVFKHLNGKVFLIGVRKEKKIEKLDIIELTIDS